MQIAAIEGISKLYAEYSKIQKRKEKRAGFFVTRIPLQIHTLFEDDNNEDRLARAFFKDLVLLGGQRANLAMTASSMALFWQQISKMSAHGVSMQLHTRVINLTSEATPLQGQSSWEVIRESVPSIPHRLHRWLPTQPATQCFVCKQLQSGAFSLQDLQDPRALARKVIEEKLFAAVCLDFGSEILTLTLQCITIRLNLLIQTV